MQAIISQPRLFLLKLTPLKTPFHVYFQQILSLIILLDMYGSLFPLYVETPRLILASPVLEEINLDYNQIGDGGARELLHALQQRKEDGFPPLKLIVTAQISPDTFQKITELSTPPKKKKKKRGKKVSGSVRCRSCIVQCMFL